MKVSESSWHYWVFKTWGDGCVYELGNGRVSLCEYFRKVCKGSMILTAVAIFSTIVVLSLLSPIGFFYTATTGNIIIPINLQEILIALGIVLWVIIGFATVDYFKGWKKLPTWWPEKLTIKSKGKPPVEKKTNIIVERYKAYKNKICPIMELKEDD